MLLYSYSCIVSKIQRDVDGNLQFAIISLFRFLRYYNGVTTRGWISLMIGLAVLTRFACVTERQTDIPTMAYAALV